MKWRVVWYLRNVKVQLMRGGALRRMCVPLVEVIEFGLSHGWAEVVMRSRVRLGMSTQGLRKKDDQPPDPGLLTIEAGKTPHERAYIEAFTRAQVSQGPDYVADTPREAASPSCGVRAIAFYLPQFHPIPENDLWWGRGFTEWTNVSKAVPQFEGHYQPHLPGELGFYDLRVPQVQRRQIELARQYGIHGFCFHYYYFGGRRLLELPLEQFVADRTHDFPFCICWANEHWSRRWDGLESELLMEQQHNPESDLAFIKEIEPLLRDPRYLTVDGRPLLIVYRVSLMPDPRATAERWRRYAADVGLKEPYLVAAQTFGFSDPTTIGFDAAVEFPPHVDPPERAHTVQLLNPKFRGRVGEYSDLAELMLSQNIGKPYTAFKTVVPSWDNEARKPGRGLIIKGSTPKLYKSWLSSACRTALRQPHPGKRLVFINAWNEWGEGAHLEPDRRYGYAHLDATRQVVHASHKPTVSAIIVGHDASAAAGLDSVLRQDERPVEVILLGHEPDAGLHDRIRTHGIQVLHLPQEVPGGRMVAIGRAAAQARGDLVWVVEAHQVVPASFLNSLLHDFERDDVMLAYGPEGTATRLTATADETFGAERRDSPESLPTAIFRRPLLSASDERLLASTTSSTLATLHGLASRGGRVSFGTERIRVPCVGYAPSRSQGCLRVCIAAHSFSIGGGELAPIVVANALKADGHHVTYLVMNEDVDGLSLRHRLRTDIPVLWWKDCVSDFPTVIRTFGFDVINSHNVSVEFAMHAGGITPGVRYVATLHGGYETVPELLTDDFVAYLRGTVHHWMYVAERNLSPLNARGIGTPATKTFNAAPSSYAGTPSDVRARLGVPENSLLCVLASRAIESKGWDVAVEAVQLARARSSRDLHLLLIGDGPYLPTSRRESASRPWVHHWGPAADVSSLIQRCDLAIFPSRFPGESFPLFLLECLAEGVPVLSTDIGDIRSLLEGGARPAGRLVSWQNARPQLVEAMAAALADLATDADALGHLAAGARQRAGDFSSARLLDIYRAVLKPSSRDAGS